MKLLFKNIQIASEKTCLLESANVLIEEGKITQIGQEFELSASAREIDGTGKILVPAMFDIHVHLREPGGEEKETVKTGSQAAIRGGITGLVCMPNTTPAVDSIEQVEALREIIVRDSAIPIDISACITQDRAGETLTHFEALKEVGIKLLTDDGDAVEDAGLLFSAMQQATPLGFWFASHCEVASLAGDRALNRGKISQRLNLEGAHASSEEICIDRDIRLAQASSAHVHIQHVSTAKGMDAIAWWKAQGVKVTAEVSPHHLIFNEEAIGDGDANFKMNPPLRTKEDNRRLLEGLINGTFDVIATDHAPHTKEEKSKEFTSAPNGILGLETAVLSLYHYFIKTGRFHWDLLIKRYSTEPRKLMGLSPVSIEVGQVAECFLFDPNQETLIDESYLCSKSQNTPFLNKKLQGSIKMVILGDNVLMDDI